MASVPSSHTVDFGRTLIIANPAAHAGEAERAAHLVYDALEADVAPDFRLTSGTGDAERIAEGAAGYDTVLVVGGDGVLHEVVGGLMRLEAPARPRVGLIPVGSGNDYARTLAIPRNSAPAALSCLQTGVERTVDLGLVNGSYFVETLSFGLDAAIALDTTDRRQAGTTQKGTALFLTSGLRIMSRYGEGWPYKAVFDERDEIIGREIAFAVQVGPTYGGGFRICPKADPTDGALDVCYNALIPPKAVALGIFGIARFGAHTGAKAIRIRQAHTLTLDFEEMPPCQVDGERLEATHFEISSCPKALRVIMASDCVFAYTQ